MTSRTLLSSYTLMHFRESLWVSNSIFIVKDWGSNAKAPCRPAAYSSTSWISISRYITKVHTGIWNLGPELSKISHFLKLCQEGRLSSLSLLKVLLGSGVKVWIHTVKHFKSNNNSGGKSLACNLQIKFRVANWNSYKLARRPKWMELCGANEKNTIVCESWYTGMFDEIQHTKDSSFFFTQIQSCEIWRSSKRLSWKVVGRPTIKAPRRRGVTLKSQVFFISDNPSPCARDTRAAQPGFIREVQKNWNISLLKYKGPLPLLLAHKLQSASEFQRSNAQSSSWAGIE